MEDKKMTQKKAIVRYMIAVMAIFIIITLITAPKNRLALSNDFFLFGLLFLTISASIFVIRGGFFHNFAKAFKKFHRIGREDEVTLEPDEKTKSRRDAGLNVVQTGSFLVGVILIGLSVLFLYLR
jgi:hypothetical protein